MLFSFCFSVAACRSQRDPLAADADAPQFVLKSIEVGQNKKGRDRKVRFDDDEEGPSEYELMKRAMMDDIRDEVAAYTRRDWELGEYNFPDDGYDYSRHLKEVIRHSGTSIVPFFFTVWGCVFLPQTGGGYFMPASTEERKKEEGFALKEEIEEVSCSLCMLRNAKQQPAPTLHPP